MREPFVTLKVIIKLAFVFSITFSRRGGYNLSRSRAGGPESVREGPKKLGGSFIELFIE